MAIKEREMDALKGFSLEEETRCDYLVTADVKKLWARQMEMALQLDRICTKHGIQYFAAGGTLLGAVRHKGFIPWDDDMDFFMMKKDYDRFCEVAPQELSAPYVFDKKLTLVRIRNQNTTMVTKRELELAMPPYNFGIFIDIFPLFAVPDSQLARKLHLLKLRFRRAAGTGRKLDAGAIQEIERNIRFKGLKSISWKCWSLFHKKDSMKSFVEMCAEYENNKTKNVGLTSINYYKECTIWPRRVFEDGIVRLPFETITLPAPKRYEEYLTKQYGNYREFVKGTAIHETMIIDTERPCSYYAEQMKNTQQEMGKG